MRLERVPVSHLGNSGGGRTQGDMNSKIFRRCQHAHWDFALGDRPSYCVMCCLGCDGCLCKSAKCHAKGQRYAYALLVAACNPARWACARSLDRQVCSPVALGQPSAYAGSVEGVAAWQGFAGGERLYRSGGSGAPPRPQHLHGCTWQRGAHIPPAHRTAAVHAFHFLLCGVLHAHS